MAVSSALAPLPDGKRQSKVMIRVRIPLRIWVAYFSIEGNLIPGQSTYLWTLTEAPRDRDHLQEVTRRWEASNVYAEANVCWGAFATELKKVKGIKALDHLFITSPFNNDLQSHWHWMTWQSWLEVDARAYPRNSVSGPEGLADHTPHVEDGRVIIPAGNFHSPFEF
jgi:hypothetical protein